MYVRGYLQGSENGRVVTIDPADEPCSVADTKTVRSVYSLLYHVFTFLWKYSFNISYPVYKHILHISPTEALLDD